MNPADAIAILESQGYTVRPPKPRRGSTKRKPVEVFTDAEVADILAEADRFSTEGVRFRAMFVLLLASGLRIGELVRLRVTSVEPVGDDMLIVHVPREGKTGARDVPIRRDSVEPYLSAWLREPGRFDCEWLFSTYAGTHVHPNSANRALKLYAERAGIERVVHAHMTRHTFAVAYLRKGGSLPELQTLLGHKSAAMSLFYANHVNIDHLTERVRSLPA